METNLATESKCNRGNPRGKVHGPKAVPRPIPKPPRFRSIKRAEKWCWKNFGLCCICSFQGGDLDVINPTIFQLTVLSNEFPEVADQFALFCIDDSITDAIAMVGELYSGLRMNAELYSDFYELMSELDYIEAMGDSPIGCNCIEYIATHEFAHEIHEWINRECSIVEVNGDTGEVWEVFNKWLISQPLDKTISRCAGRNHQEYFAEAFASHYHSSEPTERAEDAYRVVISIFQQIRRQLRTEEVAA